MQVREYEEQLPQPSSYTRWFCCMNKTCKTTLVMPARYKDNVVGSRIDRRPCV